MGQGRCTIFTAGGEMGTPTLRDGEALQIRAEVRMPGETSRVCLADLHHQPDLYSSILEDLRKSPIENTIYSQTEHYE
jgi:hypothetical protein